MGVLHEMFIAVGVSLSVMIICSVSYLGRQYLQTGHVALAIVEALRPPQVPRCLATQPHRPPPIRRG